MKLQLSPLITAISGKIGGQQIATTRNGVVIKNTVQPPRRPTQKQSVQRNITAIIANRWRFISIQQRQSFIAAAIDYKYINRLGALITRNGFQTFSFLNQNLSILNLPYLESAPIFQAITKPIVLIAPGTDAEYNIIATDTNDDYIYVVYCQIHYSLGASSFTSIPIEIGQLSAAALAAGSDIAPIIESNFATQGRTYRAAVQIVAISKTTGNRDLVPVTVLENVGQTGLGIVYETYFPFGANSLDYFGNNNMTLNGSLLSNNGIINNSLNFANVGSDVGTIDVINTLNYSSAIADQPFSFFGWFSFGKLGNQWLMNRRPTSNPNINNAYQLILYQSQISVWIYDSASLVYVNCSFAFTPVLNQQYFIGFVWESKNVYSLYVNSVSVGVKGSRDVFNGIATVSSPVIFGKASWTTVLSFFGNMSELFFANQALTQTEIDAIYAANQAGQTIIDIN